MMRRIGIYSGTFDPVHAGHLAFAREAAAQCGLDHVVFLPERQPRAKQMVSPFDTRIELLAAATAPYAELSVMTLEQASFSVAETLPTLLDRFAGAKLTFLVGSDVAQSLPHWPDIEDLLQQASIAIGLRGTATPDVVASVFTGLPSADISYVATDYPHLSSSQFRNK